MKAATLLRSMRLKRAPTQTLQWRTQNMLDCSPARATRSFFAQLFQTHFPRFDGPRAAMSMSLIDDKASGKSAGEAVGESAFAQLLQTAGFGEMGKKCVRRAAAGVAMGVLVLGGAQSSLAQTAQPGHRHHGGLHEQRRWRRPSVGQRGEHLSRVRFWNRLIQEHLQQRLLHDGRP